MPLSTTHWWTNHFQLLVYVIKICLAIITFFVFNTILHVTNSLNLKLSNTLIHYFNTFAFAGQLCLLRSHCNLLFYLKHFKSKLHEIKQNICQS